MKKLLATAIKHPEYFFVNSPESALLKSLVSSDIINQPCHSMNLLAVHQPFKKRGNLRFQPKSVIAPSSDIFQEMVHRILSTMNLQSRHSRRFLLDCFFMEALIKTSKTLDEGILNTCHVGIHPDYYFEREYKDLNYKDINQAHGMVDYMLSPQFDHIDIMKPVSFSPVSTVLFAKSTDHLQSRFDEYSYLIRWFMKKDFPLNVCVSDGLRWQFFRVYPYDFDQKLLNKNVQTIADIQDNFKTLSLFRIDKPVIDHTPSDTSVMISEVYDLKHSNDGDLIIGLLRYWLRGLIPVGTVIEDYK